MGLWPFARGQSPYVSNGRQFASPYDPSNPNDNSWTASAVEYDYVVVGGGTAGCVVASRLSEDLNSTVLLIESGKSAGNLFTRIPLAFTKSFKTESDWAYHTVPQKAMNGKEFYWARGKVLGGTSAINALIYDRCSSEDFDSWAKAGCTGWSWAELEPYFRKAEHFNENQVPTAKLKLNEKGRSGPWKIKRTDIGAPITESILDSCKELEIPHVEDTNTADKPRGVGHFPGIVDEAGKRCSTAAAYLTPDVLARPNLTVAIKNTTEKILFVEKDDGSLKAAGIQISAGPDAPKFRVRAKKEVVLCAGTVSSPHLLLVSGVGAKAELEAAGVECIKDLPHVGKHLSDHISSGPIIFRAKPEVTLDYINAPLHAAFNLIKWLWSGSGPFGTLAVPSAAFVRSDNERRLVDTSIGPVKDLSSGPNSPDIEVLWSPLVVPDFFTVGKPGESGITIAAITLKPDSEGSITFKSASIWDRPLLDGNYFSSESDINIAMRGVRLILKLVRTQPLKSYIDFRIQDNPDKSSYFWLADNDPDKLTNEELRAFVLRNGHPACHPAGTCRMGSSPDNSVVDPELKVHGIQGLRVVDASVFPTQVSGHPAAPIVAMAEKLADMVKAEHSSSRE
ncbi:GMC oxidoreductase [Panus rudis PR-1116 ss-1]|nr:GMC oxidoreductase [Panus rudis PR-1116 ss-1]